MPEFHKEIFALRPWYHDFTRLGIRTDFRGYPPSLAHRVKNLARCLAGRKPREYGILDSRLLTNQRCKEALLIPFLQQAFLELPENPRCLELFCADGYYSCLMKSMCAGASITGVDRDGRAIRLAAAISRVLGYDSMEFVEADAWDYTGDGNPYDIVFCAGGLYHLADPRGFIRHIKPMVAQFLILQTVVTLESEDPDYFITPAPGWRHGSRFTHAAIRKWLTETGFTILDEARNELEGNARLCDRGSSYFLAVPQIGDGADLLGV